MKKISDFVFLAMSGLITVYCMVQVYQTWNTELIWPWIIALFGWASGAVNDFLVIIRRLK